MGWGEHSSHSTHTNVVLACNTASASSVSVSFEPVSRYVCAFRTGLVLLVLAIEGCKQRSASEVCGCTAKVGKLDNIVVSNKNVAVRNEE